MLPKNEILHNKTSLNYRQLQYSLLLLELFPSRKQKVKSS